MAAPLVVVSSEVAAAPSERPSRLIAEVQGTIEDVSGETLTGIDPATTFTRLGLDSLVLTQVALALSRRYGVRIAFRQLLESMPSVHAVAEHLDRVLPPEVVPVVPNVIAAGRASVVPAAMAASASPLTGPAVTIGAGLADVFAQQVQLLQRQLDMLAGLAAGAAPVPVQPTVPALASASADVADVVLPAVGPTREVYDATRAFGAAMRVTLTDHSGDLSPRQRARLDAFVRRYTARTAGSKRYTAQHRDGMADPRVATGFRPLTKELVYPIVVTRSSGARVWDVDGNEYIDVLSGFGSNLLGWTSPVVVDAITAQMANGFEVGPQHVLAGEVGEKFRAMTGAERVAFCNTGSEAVLGAIRIARTVTGRPLVAIFSGSYHGINDEVIVRARKDHRAVPAAPGIMGEATENVLILDYGTPESLAILEARADDIAAVIVEPVQSRRPDFQPRDFLASVRELTSRTGMVYIWDEIVTGFRAAPGGAQEHFGIRADLATYGKIVGGGLPIGVIAGKREFMDALDGGAWQYGDASVPEVGVTYFAGTFVRHPLALAAANAMLDELAARGPALQRDLSQRTAALAASINERANALGVPIEVRHFASIWKTFVTAPTPHSDLLFYALRERGIHIYDGFPCFMTAAHGDDECETIIDAFDGAMDEMREGGFLPASAATI
jgi:glutamate-1-semialdehyde aminotransferase/acyl carrier protein